MEKYLSNRSADGETDEREGTLKKIKRFRSMRKVATMRGSGAQQAMRGYPRVQESPGMAG